MMKTTLGGSFLALTVLAGLLMTSVAIAQKQDDAAVRMETAPKRQLVEEGQCDVQPKFVFYVSVGSAKASLDAGRCPERLGDEGQSNQVAATRTRFALAGLPAGRGSGSTMMVALFPVAGDPVHLLGPLLSAETPIVGDVTDLGIPSWLYCKLHPRWCKNL
jgi:hypothetical protein